MTKIGMRTIKTGVGVTLCALLGPFLVQNPTSSAVACLISMQDTVSGSLSIGLSRIQGTIFGGIIGFLVLSMFPGNPFFCGVGVIFIIYICNLLKINKSTSISCITFLTIQMGFLDSSPAIIYSFNRILDTCVGVIIAIIINFALARPNYLKTLYLGFEKIEEDINNYLKYKVLDEENVFNLEDFVKDMNELELLYTKLIGEIGYHRENINIDNVEYIMKLCREVNFHIQSIELLQKKLYLNQKSYDKLAKLYNEDNIIFELDEKQSPVFNYHLVKVIEHSKKINKENSSHKNNVSKKKFFSINKKKSS